MSEKVTTPAVGPDGTPEGSIPFVVQLLGMTFAVGDRHFRLVEVPPPEYPEWCRRLMDCIAATRAP